MSDDPSGSGSPRDDKPIGLRRRAAAPPPAESSAYEADEDAWRAQVDRDARDFGAPSAGSARQDARNDVDIDLGDENRVIYERRARPAEAMPYNIEAEAALIGALLIDNRLVEDLRPILSEQHFFVEGHRVIYATILKIVDRGSIANPVTLRPLIKHEPSVVALGGDQYPFGLTKTGAALIGARDFANQVIELAIRRELLWVVDEADELLLDMSSEKTIDEAVGVIDAKLSDVAHRARPKTTFTIQQAWDEAFGELEEMSEGKEPDGLIIDQYEDWNAVVGRIGPGDLVYLAGRPSMGKTGVSVAVAFGAAARMAKETGPDAGAVEYFSLEMRRQQILQRAIANAIFTPGVTSGFTALTEARYTSRDRQLIRKMRAQIDTYPLDISDPDAMIVENMASEIRRRQRAWQKRGRRLKLVVVDYLSRLSTTARVSGQQERVTHISHLLKDAAKSCGVAMVVLCQLSRAVEQREDKRPVLADLRDSGALEQDADIVVFVYRDEYYLERSEPPKNQQKKWEAWDEEMRAAADRLELIGGKRRQGALARRTGYFFASSQAVRPNGYRYGNDLFSAEDDDPMDFGGGSVP